MTINAINHLAVARDEMNPAERHLFSALATGLGHTPAALTGDQETVTHLRQVAQIVARTVRDDLEEELTDLLFDAVHDACDDECTGGGRLWYERMARRLTDPGNPLADIADERERQDERWGEQNHPDGTGGPVMRNEATAMRARRRYLADHGGVDWRAILLEKVYEALAEDDPARLRAELVRVAAVATAWIEGIDRRRGYGVPGYHGQTWAEKKAGPC